MAEIRKNGVIVFINKTNHHGIIKSDDEKFCFFKDSIENCDNKDLLARQVSFSVTNMHLEPQAVNILLV